MNKSENLNRKPESEKWDSECSELERSGVVKSKNNCK